jgi:hypothetical protein
LKNGTGSGVISWSSSGEVHSRIGIKLNISEYNKIITFEYTQNGENIKYDVRLVSIPSNLGRNFIFRLSEYGKHYENYIVMESTFCIRGVPILCIMKSKCESKKKPLFGFDI